MPIYRALNGLTIPFDRTEVDRLLNARDKGEPIPFEDRQLVTYEAGEIIDYVPEESIEWLLEQGHIEEVKEEVTEEDFNKAIREGLGNDAT